MTKTETLKIMAVLKAAYPRYYHGLTDEDAKQAVMLWHSMFEGHAYPVVNAAVKAMIVTEKFSPTIADVMEKIRLITEKPSLGELEAWGIVKQALRNGYYHSQEEFEKLPQEIQATLGRHDALREWAQAEGKDIETVVGSNFMRSFRAKSKQHSEWMALPSDVKAFMIDSSAAFDMGRAICGKAEEE